MNKIKPLFSVFLICFLVLASVPQIKVVKAQGNTIYIRADGRVEPSTEFIQRNGDVYTLIGDFDDFVLVEKNNTVFDGAGHAVGGVYGPLMEQSDYPWKIDFVYNITIVNTVINGDGIFFLNSSNLVIANNTLNNGRGIDCTGNENRIANNTVNSGRGIGINGKWNIISGNRLTTCNYTFVPDNPPPYGIYVGGSNNTVTGNYITRTNGTAISLGTSSKGIIVGNIIVDNKVGIYTVAIFSQGENHNNHIYNNNFINNTENVQNEMNPDGLDNAGAVNIWDNGTTGNYWSNYNGTDNDRDGIGDFPYIIDDINQDNYPLIEPILVYPPPKDELEHDSFAEFSSQVIGFFTSEIGVILLSVTIVALVLIITLVIIARKKLK